MMVQAGPPAVKPMRLRGYKEIAIYLEHWHGVTMSESEVCRWASWNTPKDRRLPTQRPTPRRVFAVPAQLDAWVHAWLGPSNGNQAH